MASRVIKTEEDRAAWIEFLAAQNLPMTVSKLAGVKRSLPQNAILHKWMMEVAAYYGDRTPGEVKAECNLTFGRPILARDNPEWEAAFGYIFDNLSYQAKLKAIRVLDIPFTRQMTVSQLTEYLDGMLSTYRSQGIFLTDPNLQGYEPR